MITSENFSSSETQSLPQNNTIGHLNFQEQSSCKSEPELNASLL